MKTYIILSTEKPTFLSYLKLADHLKRYKIPGKTIADPLSFCLIYLTHMKDAFTPKFRLCRKFNAQHCPISMDNVWMMSENLAHLWHNSLKLEYLHHKLLKAKTDSFDFGLKPMRKL